MSYLNPLLATPARPLPRRVAIIGAGTIGPDIGYYLKSALPELELVLLDVEQRALDAALARFAGYAAKALARGKLSERQAAGITQGVTATLDYARLRDCDWVLEAATENLALKQRIFAQVEALVSPRALVTSNTSSLPAARIFAGLRHKERATVTHFFAPAWRNPVVEVIEWPEADPHLVQYLRWLFCATGKVPLLTRDVACFMLDRVFDNWCNEAAHCLAHASAAEIDGLAGELVHAGPFFVLNLARGNPIIVETNTLQADEEGEHYRPAPIFRSVERWAGVAPGGRRPVAEPAAGAVRDRLLGVLLSQAADIVDREIGAAADLDLGCRLALGFKRGPLELMQDLGETESRRILERFARERPGMPMPRQPHAAYGRFERDILVDDLDGVKVITLRRPEALNALHDALTDEVLAAIRRHEDDPAVAGFVITGYGTRAFCAGADIGRFPALLGDAQASAQYARDCSRLLVHLDAMRKPVVAALNGMALGGGFELATRCHGIVAVRSAWLQLPEITLGIVPGIGALAVPYRRWPQAAPVFHGMLRRAERLDAERAHALGVVDALADDYASLVRRAVARVRELRGTAPRVAQGRVELVPLAPVEAKAESGQVLSREAVGIVEQAVREAAAAPTLAAALEAGYRAFGRSACTAAAREGIGAFLARRAPDFAKTG
ncbi:MAG: 3-hydroxyacyl-CoA dehydrogenase NAD-binding domain-containing protein [Betaproteobacteria bacterium]|nr:3-hydroxyacyl-CoA dehydrogenase NAD-binding domain-containing protein [Betaproteobacteria bacterium]